MAIYNLRAAINTIRAPWWKVRLAQVFGTRIEAEDSGHKVVMHRWRGVVYLTDFITPVP
jgi:hypothetical protein